MWITLLTSGVGDAYFAALQTFILGVMAAYKKGFSLQALQMELSVSKVRIITTALSAQMPNRYRAKAVAILALFFFVLRTSFLITQTPRYFAPGMCTDYLLRRRKSQRSTRTERQREAYSLHLDRSHLFGAPKNQLSDEGEENGLSGR